MNLPQGLSMDLRAGGNVVEVLVGAILAPVKPTSAWVLHSTTAGCSVVVVVVVVLVVVVLLGARLVLRALGAGLAVMGCRILVGVAVGCGIAAVVVVVVVVLLVVVVGGGGVVVVVVVVVVVLDVVVGAWVVVVGGGVVVVVVDEVVVGLLVVAGWAVVVIVVASVVGLAGVVCLLVCGSNLIVGA